MKVPLVIAAMMLLCFPAYSQEADDLGNESGAELSVVDRTEFPFEGNTSLYTLFEGNISSNLSFSVSNHWFSFGNGNLYSNTFRSDDVNWLDWAYLTWSFDHFEISAGKDILPWGTLEMDEYDYDIYTQFASSVWSDLAIYQWGLKTSWLPTDELTFDFRVSTSPYGEHPFSSGLYAFGLRGRWTTETTDLMCAYNAMQTDPDNMIGSFSAGASHSFGNFTVAADFNSRPGDEENIFASGCATAFRLGYQFNDSLNLKGYASYENYDRLSMYDAKTGAVVEWYPFESLRIHALAGWQFGDFNSGVLYCIGATYTLSTSFGK